MSEPCRPQQAIAQLRHADRCVVRAVTALALVTAYHDHDLNRKSLTTWRLRCTNSQTRKKVDRIHNID